jgi:hypothetical protein
MTTKICSICQNEFKEFGNNAWPINDGECCDRCNDLVIQARFKLLREKQREIADAEEESRHSEHH